MKGRRSWKGLMRRFSGNRVDAEVVTVDGVEERGKGEIERGGKVVGSVVDSDVSSLNFLISLQNISATIITIK